MGKAQHVVLLQLLHGVYNAEVGFSAKSQAGYFFSPQKVHPLISQVSLAGSWLSFIRKLGQL